MPSSENRLENLIKMELNFKPIPSESVLHGVSSIPKQLSLILNINFGEHIELLPDGRSITFGLRRGELRISLTNGEIELRNVKLANSFQTEIEKEIQTEKSQASQTTARLGVNLGGDTSRKEGNKSSEKIKYKEYQVKLKWEKNNTLWIFEAKTNKEVLEGLLQNCEMATIDIIERPCKLLATFEINDIENIYINNLTWKKPMNKIINVIAKIKMDKIFIERLIKPRSYLSRVELSYE